MIALPLLPRMLVALLLCMTPAFAMAQQPEAPDASSAERPQGLVGAVLQQEVVRVLAGEWVPAAGADDWRLTLRQDGTFQLGNQQGIWRIDATTLTLQSPQQTQVYNYTYKRDDDTLTLSGGDIGGQTLFVRYASVSGFVQRIFGFNWTDAAGTAVRILAIVGIVLLIRLGLELVRLAAKVIIFAEWGPMKLIYRRHKNRAMTIYVLILNFVKYAVYLTAVGFVLRELGVNYVTYLASLSVIGLAIGFGSQGLVQDTVTGFFIIFEGQFDVGDMVEISGQTGIVEELGLRMTKLRNYAGQVVVIPNRNIAVVGNYTRGAMVANVEVAIAGLDVADKASIILRRVGEQLRRQFEGAILRPPRIGDPLSLSTGEHFVRMHIAIWPGQQWVVDQQLMPRVREAFQRAELEIPADRIVTYYFPRQYYKPTDWRTTLAKLAGRTLEPTPPEPQRSPEPDAGRSG